MGVILSTESALAPISFASTIIGFISFAFTLGTFLRVSWVNLETMAEPSHRVHMYLNNLREELLEEKASLRVLRKANKHRRRSRRKLPDTIEQLASLEMDEVTIKTMDDTIRTLIKEFKGLERPFLQDGEDGIQQANKRRSAARRRGGASPSSQYGDSPYTSGYHEKRGRSEERPARDEDEDDDMFWAQRVQYGRYNVHKRMIWLYKKSTARHLYDALSKVQTRRLSRQVNSMTIMMREYGDCTLGVEDSLGRIEDRLSRVVGLRRVD